MRSLQRPTARLFALLPRSPRGGARALRPRRRRGSPGRGDGARAGEPALLRARGRVPAPGDEEPRHVQPAVREHVGGERARVRGDPPLGPRRHGVTARAPRIPRPVGYLLLGLSLALVYVIPPASLLLDPPLLRYLAASVLAFAPVFFANLVFTSSFRDTRTADMAFASNVVGAVVGGLPRVRRAHHRIPGAHARDRCALCCRPAIRARGHARRKRAGECALIEMRRIRL